MGNRRLFLDADFAVACGFPLANGRGSDFDALRHAHLEHRPDERPCRPAGHQRGEPQKWENEVPMNESPRGLTLVLPRSLLFSLLLLICIYPAVPARGD